MEVIIDGNIINCIKVKPRWMEIFPLTGVNTITAIYPNIYIPEKHLAKFTAKDSDPKYKATLLHELEHIKREKQQGMWKFGLRYIFFSKFRLEEELIADKASINYLKKQQIKFDIAVRAKMLSGWNYLWPASIGYVTSRLEQLWAQS